jgi:hypothetical protein
LTPKIFAPVDDETYQVELSLAPHVKEGKMKTAKGRNKKCDSELLKSICEISLNVLSENIPLKACQKHLLSKHKTALRTVADKQLSIKSKKQFIKQKGGFIIQLLSTILPMFVSLLFKNRG